MATIHSTTTGQIVTVTIDSPPVNALRPDAWVAIADAMNTASIDPDVRAVVLTGTSGRFCAGADISILAEPQEKEAYMLGIVGHASQAISDCRVPVIAGIDGPAHGGGLELALACDIRVASPQATFAASGVNMGLIASVPRLSAAIGTTRASLMLLTGSPIDGPRAEEWALATLLDDEPQDRAQVVAQEIATKAPAAVEANKRALRAFGSISPAEHAAMVTTLFTSLETSADHQEAVDAFLNKRRPVFGQHEPDSAG